MLISHSFWLAKARDYDANFCERYAFVCAACCR